MDLRREIKLSDLVPLIRGAGTRLRRSKAPARARPAAASGDPPLMRAFNLLPEELRRAAGPQRTRLPVIAAAAAVGVLVLLGGVFALERSQAADKRAELEGLQVELAALERAESEAGGEALAAEREQRATVLASAVASRIAWDGVLRTISRVLPDDVWLTGLRATAPASTTAAAPTGAPGAPTGLTITGYARSQAGVARLLSRLAHVPQLASVQLQTSSATEADGRPVVQFTVVGNVASPVPGS